MSNDKATKMAAQQALQAKRAVLYARVSGDDRGKDGRNLKSQLDMCREYAQSKGYAIVAELHEDDRGASGASFELPMLARVLAMAEGGEYDVLVVRELDRLSRNLAKQLIVEESLKRCSVGVEYVLADYDDTPEGNLQKHIRATVAEYEREKIRERMVRGRRNKVKAGHVMTHGRSPYGYRLTDDKKTLVVYEPEAQVVRQIFAWYIEGDESGKRLSAIGIADKLTRMQIPTWADTSGFPRNKRKEYGQWASHTIIEILHNELYTGQWAYAKGSGNSIYIPVQPIVDAQTWDAAQAQCKENTATARRNARYDYLLQYRARCVCGYAVSSKRIFSHGKAYFYYECASYRPDVLHPKCGLPYFRADHVDMVVWNWVRGWLQDSAKIGERLQAYKDEHDKANAPLLALLDTNERLLSRERGRLARLLDLYLYNDGDDMGIEAYKAKEAELKEIIAKLEAEKARLMESLEPCNLGENEIEEIVNFAHRLSIGLDHADASFEARRRIIELLDVRVTLAVENGEKVVYATLRLTGDDKPERLSIATTSK